VEEGGGSNDHQGFMLVGEKGGDENYTLNRDDYFETASWKKCTKAGQLNDLNKRNKNGSRENLAI